MVPHTTSSASKAEQDGSAEQAAQQAAEAEEADMNAMTAGMTAKEVELLRSRQGRKCRVWARRVWTLELSLVSGPLKCAIADDERGLTERDLRVFTFPS